MSFLCQIFDLRLVFFYSIILFKQREIDMLEKLIYTGIVFMGFSAIMNPISGMSIFLTLTSQEDEQNIRKIAFQSTLTAFIIVVCFAIAGNLVLNFFGVTFTALRLTGGILVAIIGYEMLQGQSSNVNKPTKETLEKVIKEESSIAVTPLGIPLLAGPGVIITAMNFSAGNPVNIFITILGFGILCILTYYVFIFGKQIKKVLGASALKVITKMMGLILTVIGMQMLLEGIYAAINDFKALNYF